MMGTITVTPHKSPDDRSFHRDLTAADLKFLRTGKRPVARPRLSTPHPADGSAPKGWRLKPDADGYARYPNGDWDAPAVGGGIGATFRVKV